MTPELALASYAAACLRLYLEALDRGVALPLRDVEVHWCESGTEALLVAPDGKGDFMFARFDLPGEVDEESFDPRPYLEAFEHE